jgi:hypothetical protein
MSAPDLSWFWSIVDKEEFAAVPSDEREALARILAERDRWRLQHDAAQSVAESRIATIARLEDDARALLAERDAAFPAGYAAGFDRGQCHGAETMRERAVTEVDTWQGAEPTTEEHPQRLVWAVLKTKAEAIRALPLVQP